MKTNDSLKIDGVKSSRSHSEFSYGGGTQSAYSRSLHSLPMGETCDKKTVTTFFDPRRSNVPKSLCLSCRSLLVCSVRRISKKGVVSFLMGLMMMIFIMASYMLVSDKKGLMVILSHGQSSSVDVGTRSGSAEVFAESTLLNMTNLVKAINSKQNYRQRKVPDVKDVIQTDSHLFTVIPRQFLSGIKSPCWYQEYTDEPGRDPYANSRFLNHTKNFKNQGKWRKNTFHRHILHQNGKRFRLRCLPYFYIIGQPKCGTTDLFHRLLLHPDIRFSGWKEPHWWTRRRFGYSHTKERPEEKYSVEDYLDLFDSTAQRIQEGLSGNSSGDHHARQTITGDGSASTMWDNGYWSFLDQDRQEPRFLVQDFIHTINPTAKIIIILRDPAERLYSDYLYFKSSSKSAKAFHRGVVRSVLLFQSCIAEKSLHSCAYDTSLHSATPVRLHLGLYIVFLLDWLTVFHRDQVFVLQLEEYAANMKVAIKKVFDFLDLGPLSAQVEAALTQLPMSNTRRAADTTLGPMLPATKKLLRDFYQPFNQKLAKVLDNNAFLWSDT